MKIAVLMIAVLMTAACLAACAKTVNVTVNDMGAKTEVEVKTGMKISEVLDAAKITLGEKDVVEPAADTALTESITEIVVKRYAKVTVVKDGVETVVEMVGGTVEDALKEAKITFADGEEPDTDPKSYVKDGMVIGISKEIKVKITVDGETRESTTKATSVEALLEEKGITLGKDDEVSEKLDTKLADGMSIVIKRVEYKEETKTESIDYSTREEYSDSMAEGTGEVTQSGSKGEKTVTYKVKYADGKEESREVVSEKITKEPVDEVVTYGTASSSGNGGGGRYEVSREAFPNCADGSHGYYEIHYSDGSVEYVEY
jgi:uncharacterized protein YabE (DUF348 family)